MSTKVTERTKHIWHVNVLQFYVTEIRNKKIKIRHTHTHIVLRFMTLIDDYIVSMARTNITASVM
jgi:hypothetical protein